MINIGKVKKFCKDYTKIENYEEAVNDQSQVWHCHHILGEILTRQQLLDHDFYYDVPPCMLKFVTKAEHVRLHKKGKCLSDESRKKISEARKGHTVTEETRKKISEANKGEKNPLFGKHFSDESRKKISESLKGEKNPNFGKHHSEESRKKISEAVKRYKKERKN